MTAASLDKPTCRPEITADTPITADVIAAMTFAQRAALHRKQSERREATRVLMRRCRAANTAAQRAETDEAYQRALARYKAANDAYEAKMADIERNYRAAFPPA